MKLLIKCILFFCLVLFLFGDIKSLTSYMKGFFFKVFPSFSKQKKNGNDNNAKQKSLK